MNVINPRVNVLELKGASGMVGMRCATRLAREKNKPVLVRYSNTQINGVNPNGVYSEMERETWEKNDSSKPMRYLPGRFFSSVSEFDHQLSRLS